jgi:integral membrane protein
MLQLRPVVRDAIPMLPRHKPSVSPKRADRTVTKGKRATMTEITPPSPTRSSDWLFTAFRLVALVEGLTTLALFLVAMPLKYMFDDPSWVPMTGLIHGYAFIAYIVMMGIALNGRGWGQGAWLRTTLAAFFPFGTFLNDPYLKRQKAIHG